MVKYAYNAWGMLVSTTGTMATTLGVHNPLRYRGYVYDPEYSLYYLQSRYYDPQLIRFINADVFASTGAGILGNNMFAYCNNSPVTFEDASGHALKPCTTYINDGAKALLDSPSNDERMESTEEYHATSSLGVAGSIGLGPWALGAQVFITVDSNSNIALQYSTFGGLSAGANANAFSWSLMPIIMVTNAPGYQALEDKGIQIGASCGGYSVDYVGMLASNGEDILYHGISVGFGASTPDAHVTWGTTGTIFATEFDWEMYYQVTRY